MKRETKIWIALGVAVAVMLLLSWFWGYSVGHRGDEIIYDTITNTEVRYIKGDTVIQRIDRPVPYRVTDTIVKEIELDKPFDTMAVMNVWRDYFLEREYDLAFGNDTLGDFNVHAKVQENQLLSAEAVIQPNIKTITETKTVYVDKIRKIQPYVLVGTSVNLRCNQLQAGIDIKQKYSVGASVIRQENKVNYTINIGYKF